jgi:hypothetical protein
VLRRHELRSFFLISGVAEPNTDKLPNKNPLFMIEEEQREHIAKLNKMEREMEEVSSIHFITIYFLRTRQSPTVDPQGAHRQIKSESAEHIDARKYCIQVNGVLLSIGTGTL